MQRMHPAKFPASLKLYRAAIMLATAASSKSVLERRIDVMGFDRRWPARCDRQQYQSISYRPRRSRAADQLNEITPSHAADRRRGCGVAATLCSGIAGDHSELASAD